VRLRLTGKGFDEKALMQQVEDYKNKMVDIVKYAVAGYEDDTMPVVIGRALKERGLKIAFAESCTGGYLSHLITTIAGSSEYFEGSVIAYSYELKEKLLGVAPDILNTYGAVSEECVNAMVKGALERLGVDMAVAVSGIAGPGGATPEKPVGTIWMACGNKEDTITAKLGLDRGRLKNIEYAGNSALNLIRKFLLTH
jgi:nicotinamide-nucleotide amidase